MALDTLGNLPQGAEKQRRVQAMFDRIAGRYDALNRLFTLGLDQRWRALALEAVAVGRGDRLVDVACGTGDLAQLASARGARVVGVDFSRQMLRGARTRRLPAALLRADAERLPFPDAWASVVTCGFALRNFVHLERALGEMARVLEPGGRLALVEVDRPRSASLRRFHSIYFDRVVPRLGGWLSDREAYAYLPRSTAYLPPPEELRLVLERAGFVGSSRRSLLWGSAQLLIARRAGGRA